MKGVGKYGVVERALYDGLHGVLFFLWKAIEIDNFILFLGPDNLNTSKENEMFVEILIDFQFDVMLATSTLCQHDK